MFRGKIVAIYTAPEKGAPMEPRDGVEATAGVGLDGDRYATGEGKYTRRRMTATAPSRSSSARPSLPPAASTRSRSASTRRAATS